jgi:hypothetical protein
MQPPCTKNGYTGAAVETLTSFENTVVQGLFDESGSTGPFARQMELACKEIIKALRHSPRADNLIYRQSHFGSRYREHHGFLPLAQINEAMYDGCYQPGGSTTLFDSEDRSIRELLDYCKKQAAMKYLTNGMLFAITDGCDYGSTLTENDAKKAFTDAAKDEDLESLYSVLIGVNPEQAIQDALQEHATKVGYTKYIPLDKADEKIESGSRAGSTSRSKAAGSFAARPRKKFALHINDDPRVLLPR